MMMIKGKCLGVQTAQRGKGDNRFNVTILGIAETKNDLFSTEVVTEVQLSRKHAENGMVKKLNDQTGKEITVEVWQKHNASGARVFTNTHLVDLVQ